MLTRQDETVEDCLDVYESIRESGILRIGFKDVGVDRETLLALTHRIKADGGTSYLEVVSSTPETALASARMAVDLGVDRLLGGTEVTEILAVVGPRIAYHPFAGRPFGHPTRLRGTPEEVARDCRRFAEMGCAGVDLLAYRAVEADPVAMIRAARAATPGCLVVAGSVNTPQRIREVREAGADAFTVGSAAFEGAFSARKGSLRSQLREILAAAAS